MSEAKFFTTDGQEIARLDDVTLVPECLKEEIQEAVFTRLDELFEAELKADTRGSDLLRSRIAMGLIPDRRMIPKMLVRKPGWERVR